MTAFPSCVRRGLLPFPHDQYALTRREFSEYSFLQNNQIHGDIEQTIDGMLDHVFLSFSGTTEAENLP